LTGPGECAWGTRTRADSTGVTSLWFAVDETIQDDCVGSWFVDVSAEGSGEYSYNFVLTAP
jgi:hypothetical protein